MIVVADTSVVVLNLCCVRKERLLSALFGRVLAPTEVAAEFRRLAGVDVRFSGLISRIIHDVLSKLRFGFNLRE